MDFAFTSADPLSTTLFDRTDGLRCSSYAVHTCNHTTTIEKSLSLRTSVSVEHERQGKDFQGKEMIPVVRIHWSPGSSVISLGDEPWAGEKPIHAIMPRVRWRQK